ncbi:MAG: hypothetical protein ACU0CA_10580 [Paracoccaceae bacterium]
MKVVFDLSVTSARVGRIGSAVDWDAAWNSPNTNTSPGLVLDFAAGVYGAAGTLEQLYSTLSMIRSSEGSRIDQSGALDLVAPNVARIDHDPVTLAPRGLLLEPSSTNQLSQSNAPVDQIIQVDAVTYVLSFYGNGSVSFTGAHTESYGGTSGYPMRSSFVFTPIAGDLNISFSGDVLNPQIEKGTIATSYIPSGAIATQRDDDIASVPLGNWFNPDKGTLVFGGSLEFALANDRIIEIDTGATSTRLSLLWNTVLGKPQFQVWEGGALQAAIAPPGNSINMAEHFRVAIAYSANDFVVSLNGGGVATDTSGTIPTGLTTLRLGRSVWGAQGQMTAESLIYFPTRLSNAEVQDLSA